MNNQEMALIIKSAIDSLTELVILGVIAYLIGLTVKQLASDLFTWVSILLSREQGTREKDLVERGGKIYEIRSITFTRVRFENIEDVDDRRSIPLNVYWKSEIHSVACKRAYRDIIHKSNRRSTDTPQDTRNHYED